MELNTASMASEVDFDPNENLATEMGEEQLGMIGERAARGYEADEQSMADWKDRSDEAMELATMVSEGGNWPFEGCSNLSLPTVAQAVIQFAARAYPAIINDNKPVKARTMGRRGPVSGMPAGDPMGDPMGQPAPPAAQDGPLPMGPTTGPQMPGEMPASPSPQGLPPMMGDMPPGLIPPNDPGGMEAAPQADGGNVDEDTKQNSADRQSDFMSWQLLEQMEEWEGELDRTLHILPAIGSAWRKVWYDPTLGRNRSDLIHPKDVVINNRCSSVERLPRLSVDFELYPWEVEERMRDGRWRRTVLEHEGDEGDDEDAPIQFVEQLCRLDVDGDGYDEPVIVVYHKASREVLRVARDYMPEDVVTGPDGDVVKIDRFSQYILFTFIPDPAGGLLGLGFGHLLRSLAKAANGITNLLVDAGILANAGGGFIRKSARIPAKQINGGLNKWHVADVPEGVDPFVPFPRPAPDATLFNMLGMIQNTAKEITSTTDLMMGDLSKNVAPTTALAMIEQGTKVYTAIYKRVYRSLKREYKALAKLNSLFLDPYTYFEFNDSSDFVSAEDFDLSTLDVVPAADPNMVSDMSEMARVGALQSFMGDPLIDQVKLRKRMLRAMKAGEDMLAPPPPPPEPDPQLQIETAKLELEQQKLQLEQQRMQMQMQMDQQKAALEAQFRQAELQIKAQDSAAKAAQAASKGGEGIPEGPSPLEQAKAAQAATQARIDAMKAPLEADKLRAETELTLAKAGREASQTGLDEHKAALETQVTARQEYRADRAEDRADKEQRQSAQQGPAEG